MAGWCPGLVPEQQHREPAEPEPDQHHTESLDHGCWTKQFTQLLGECQARDSRLAGDLKR